MANKKQFLTLLWLSFAACKSAGVYQPHSFSDHYGKEIGQGRFTDADTIEATGFAHHSGSYGATMEQISQQAARHAEEIIRNICLPEGPERILEAVRSTLECHNLSSQLRLKETEKPLCATDGRQIDCNIQVVRRQSGLRESCNRCNRLRLYGEKAG